MGTGAIFLDQLSCDGTEMGLLSCQHFSLATGIPGSSCEHSDDVVVQCEGNNFESELGVLKKVILP